METLRNFQAALLSRRVVARCLEAEEKKAIVRKEKGKGYCVKSPDNPDWSGGCYPSKGEAEKRLHEVEYFKHKKESARKDKVPGGRADKKDPKDFDPKQLAKGKKVEMEHTDNPDLALEIAMDHLTEDPKYYDYLEEMESKFEKHAEFIGKPRTVADVSKAIKRAIRAWDTGRLDFDIDLAEALGEFDKKLKEGVTFSDYVVIKTVIEQEVDLLKTSLSVTAKRTIKGLRDLLREISRLARF
jgi:hypothetical protein